MKRDILLKYETALQDTLPYGFIYDETKGVVVFNRNYEALFFKSIGDVKLLDFDPKDLDLYSIDHGYYGIVTSGEELHGVNYFLHEGLPYTQKELVRYLINLNKFLSCFISHTDKDAFWDGSWQVKRKKNKQK